MSTKPAAARRARRRLGRLEVGVAEPAVADRREDRLDRGDVAGAAALGDEPAARPEDRGQVPEQGVVVGDPVERRGREDRVDRMPPGSANGRPRSATTYVDPVAEPAPAAGAPRRPSPATRRGRRPGRRGSRSARSSVTRPLPQPASRTVSSPSQRRAARGRPRPSGSADRRRGRTSAASQSRGALIGRVCAGRSSGLDLPAHGRALAVRRGRSPPTRRRNDGGFGQVAQVQADLEQVQSARATVGDRRGADHPRLSSSA